LVLDTKENKLHEKRHKETKCIMKKYFTCWTPSFIVGGFSDFSFNFCVVEDYVGTINIQRTHFFSFLMIITYSDSPLMVGTNRERLSTIICSILTLYRLVLVLSTYCLSGVCSDDGVAPAVIRLFGIGNEQTKIIHPLPTTISGYRQHIIAVDEL